MEEYIDYLVNISDSIDPTKITILTGRNAGGKSLIRKLLSESLRIKLNKKKVLIPHASQEIRTKTISSMGALGSMTHDMEWLATSKNTLYTINHILKMNNVDYFVIDEPEIGCGEELQLGMCDYLNEKFKDIKTGCLIITHSKNIVKNLNHDIFINLEKMSEQEWLDRIPKKISIEDFDKFSTELFETLRDRINRNKI